MDGRDKRECRVRSDAWFYAALRGNRRVSPQNSGAQFWTLSLGALGPRALRRISILLMLGSTVVLATGTHPLVEQLVVAFL
jgi:hypothetical protein